MQADAEVVYAERPTLLKALTVLSSDASSQRDRATLTQLETGLASVGGAANAILSGDQQTATQDLPTADAAIGSATTILDSKRLVVCGGSA
jgi:hypothetical protein